MANILRGGTFEAADLVKMPPPTRPVLLKSGGPVMEAIGADGDAVLCEWPDGRGTFPAHCLYSLVPFEQQPEAVESAVKAERERIADFLEKAEPPFDVPGFLAGVIRSGDHTTGK